MAERYELVIIGSGPGGYVAAIRAAQLGVNSIAIIEKAAPRWAALCLNVGCIPSKAMLDSSELYAQAKSHFGSHGISVGDLKIDLLAMLARKDKVVKGLTEGVGYLMKKNKIAVFTGTAKLAGPPEGGVVRVSVKGASKDTLLEAKAVLLATGSEPVGLPALPFDGTNIVSSTEALSFDKVPQHLIVVGAGYIGLELGSVWARLGAKVTVLEFLPRILPLSDGEIAEALQTSLSKQGLTFHLDTRVTAAGAQGEVAVVVTANSSRGETSSSRATRWPRRHRPETLHHRDLGWPKQESSYVDNDRQGAGERRFRDQHPRHLRHRRPDRCGRMLAPQGRGGSGSPSSRRLTGLKTHVDYNTVPSVIYTWPEVASVLAQPRSN